MAIQVHNDIKIVITLSVSKEDVSSFLRDWEDTREELTKIAGIDEAYIELPNDVTRIDLEK